MAQLKIVIGNKNYSSWSLRPWLALEQCGVPYEEQVIPLDQPDTAAQIARFSPSGRVPTLLDGELTIWDSLAICEYLNEKFPAARLWPKDPAARALARSVSAEMHSGFVGLRTHCPMKVKESLPMAQPREEVKADLARIDALWTDCRNRFGAGGPFLFGAFSIADAMFAPVVSRIRTYGLQISPGAKAYCDAVWNSPGMQKWAAAARAESFVMARYEKK